MITKFTTNLKLLLIQQFIVSCFILTYKDYKSKKRGITLRNSSKINFKIKKILF